MPRAFLKIDQPDQDHNVLANFCFLSRADHRTLGGIDQSIAATCRTTAARLLGVAMTQASR
jgi:hypothetical protein